MQALHTVVKANQLINAKTPLTLSEVKLVLCAIARIQPEDEDFKTYQIDAREYTELTGTQNKGESSRLRAITKSLLGKPIEVPTPDGGYQQMNFISSAKYRPYTSLVEIRFDPAMKPYLLQLKEQFTQYKLHHVMAMRSFYSVRLYELLKQYAPIGRRLVQIATLHDLLQTPKSYHRYSNFNQRVLSVAEKEINELTDLHISYVAERSGKNVTAIMFTISKNIQAKPLAAPEASLQLLKATLIKDYGLSKEQSASAAKRYAAEYIAEVLATVDYAQAKGKIKNLAAFTWTALEQDYRGVASGGLAKPPPKSKVKEVVQDEDEVRFETDRNAEIDKLVAGYDMATLLDGFDEHLAQHEKLFFDVVCARVERRGEPLSSELLAAEAPYLWRPYVARKWLAEQFHSLEAWKSHSLTAAAV